MDEEAESSKRAFPFEPRDEIIRQADALERRAEHELARVEDERLLVVRDLDELGEVLHRLLDVDVRVARVAEDAEKPVDAHVHARGLEEVLGVRIDADASLFEQPADGAVGQNHELRCNV